MLYNIAPNTLVYSDSFVSFVSYFRRCVRTCAYQGVRNVCFSESLACVVFLKHSFWDSPFWLITDVFLRIFLIHPKQCSICLLSKNVRKTEVPWHFQGVKNWTLTQNVLKTFFTESSKIIFPLKKSLPANEHLSLKFRNLINTWGLCYDKYGTCVFVFLLYLFVDTFQMFQRKIYHYFFIMEF